MGIEGSLVTDIVAHRSLKTPTAVADFLIECMSNAESHLNEMSAEIIKSSKEIFELSRQRIESCRIRLIPVARMMISEIKEELSGMIIEMINIGKEYIVRAGLFPANQMSRINTASRSFLMHNNSALTVRNQKIITSSANLLKGTKSKIDALENSLKILDPENVLKRGYTITSLHGKIIKSSSQVKKDDLISTLFSNEQVASRVVKKL